LKRREFLKLSATLAGATITTYLPAGSTPAKAAAKWKVGFSQCTTLEPWRKAWRLPSDHPIEALAYAKARSAAAAFDGPGFAN
jgi:hypothetical protein